MVHSAPCLALTHLPVVDAGEHRVELLGWGLEEQHELLRAAGAVRGPHLQLRLRRAALDERPGGQEEGPCGGIVSFLIQGVKWA